MKQHKQNKKPSRGDIIFMVVFCVLVIIAGVLLAAGPARAQGADKWGEILLSPIQGVEFDEFRARRIATCENRERIEANQKWRDTDFCDIPDLGISKYWQSSLIRKRVAPLSAKEFGIPLYVGVECPFWRGGRGLFPTFSLDLGYDPEREIRFAASREITIDDEFVPTEWKFKWDKNKAESIVVPVGGPLAITFMDHFFFYSDKEKDAAQVIAKMKRHNKLVFGVDIEGVGEVFYHISLQGIAAKMEELKMACDAYKPEDYLPLGELEVE